MKNINLKNIITTTKVGPINVRTFSLGKFKSYKVKFMDLEGKKSLLGIAYKNGKLKLI